MFLYDRILHTCMRSRKMYNIVHTAVYTYSPAKGKPNILIIILPLGHTLHGSLLLRPLTRRRAILRIVRHISSFRQPANVGGIVSGNGGPGVSQEEDGPFVGRFGCRAEVVGVVEDLFIISGDEIRHDCCGTIFEECGLAFGVGNVVI